MFTTSVQCTKENPGLSGGNTGRDRQIPIRLCERAKEIGFSLYRSERDVEWNGGGGGQKKGLKTLNCPKYARLYRYRLDLYRYTCSNFHFFFFFLFYFLYDSIFIFFQIRNRSADVKSILVDCLPSRVSLHAHLSPCSYSAQTDCVHGVDNCTSFFRHFHTYHGAHCISGDQGS